MSTGSLGKVYAGGEVIISEGDVGNCMYVIQEGEVEVISIVDGEIIRVAVLTTGDFFGETAIFDSEVRSATVRALSETRVLTIDKKTFLGRIKEDPTLAFRIVETLTKRVKAMNQQFIESKTH